MGQVTACDRCSLVQVRCRIDPDQGGYCRGCIALNAKCTWTRVSGSESSDDDSYTEYLETRVNLLEQALKILAPVTDAESEINALRGTEGTLNRERVKQEYATTGWTSHDTLGSVTPPISVSTFLDTPAISRLVQQVRLANVGSTWPNLDVSNEDVVWDASSSTKPDEPRYHGQSSSEVLSRDAGIFRNGYNASILSTVPTTYRRPEFWRPTSAEMRVLNPSCWELVDGLDRELPPADLLPTLVDAYFDNAFFPVIHRPLFEKQLREGLHLREISFLRVVLLVCACGARWCDDPRVLDDRWPVSLSAGYRWVRHFTTGRRSLVGPQLSLWDAQGLVLWNIYLCGSSANYGMWIVVGAAIRIMQDIGSHRKKSRVTLENELHKRCFWTMIFLDRFHGIHLDRHSGMQDLDSDLDDVLEVDDELWSLEPNAPPPVQPAGIPSKIAMFNRLIGLSRIAGRCLQTVYSLERTKRLIGLDGPQGAFWMFKDINAQLDQWVRSVPPHLRLPDASPHTTSPFFSDTVTMWAFYYDLVIAVNRPFIAKTTSPLASPCLKLCLGAARACAHLIDGYRTTAGSRFLPTTYYPAFSCAMILVIDLISQGKIRKVTTEDQGPDTDIYGRVYTTAQKEEDVRKCIRALEWGEAQFQISGRLRDMIREFEESWRLQLSYTPRRAREFKNAARPTHSDGAGAAVNEELEVTFDISGPPDAVLPTETSPPSTHPLESPSDSVPSYAYLIANDDNAHYNSYLASLPHSEHQPLAPSDISQGPSRNELENKAFLTRNTFQRHRTGCHMPGYEGNPNINLDYRMLGYGRNISGAAQTNEQQIFGLWPRIPSDEVATGENLYPQLEGIPPATPGLGTSAPLIAQWNMTMQNTLDLNRSY